MQEFWLKGGPGGQELTSPMTGRGYSDREVVSFDGRVNGAALRRSRGADATHRGYVRARRALDGACGCPPGEP